MLIQSVSTTILSLKPAFAPELHSTQSLNVFPEEYQWCFDRVLNCDLSLQIAERLQMHHGGLH